MIPAQALHRLVRNIVEFSAGTGEIDCVDLLDFATSTGLDTEDVATLFRVASGEDAFPAKPTAPDNQPIFTIQGTRPAVPSGSRTF